jgi:hypothetical protein
MDIFISVLLVGMAVGYLTELLASTLELFISPKTLKMILTVPMSAGGLYLFTGTLDWSLVVLAPAAGFFALAIMSVVNRPIILQSVQQRIR